MYKNITLFCFYCITYMCSHIEIVHIIKFSNSFTNTITYKYILVTVWSKLPNNPINFIFCFPYWYGSQIFKAVMKFIFPQITLLGQLEGH